MIIIEGKYDYLVRQVRKELRNRSAHLAIHAPDVFDLTEKRLFKLLHTDNRLQVRENLCDFIGKMPPENVHMMATALLATGSFVLVCHDPVSQSVEESGAHYYRSTLGGLLPGMNIFSEEFVEPIVAAALELCEENLETIGKLYDTDIWSAGGVFPDMVMLVGDRVQPYVPCDEGRRLAFVSHRGCSRFLHASLMRNYLDAGTRYYLTNAHKGDSTKLNLRMLQEEIDLVKPAKIVAMGGEAARHLSDLKVTFERTYHPQYWKRFLNKQQEELIQLLKP